MLVLSVWVTEPAFAQKEPVVDGGKYVSHTVAHKETVYSICKKYNITIKELEAANPGLSGVLDAGSKIRIPVAKVMPQPQKKTAAEIEFYYHKVQKNQTIFSIARQYEVSENDLIRYNPEVAGGPKIGQILKIPVNDSGGGNQPVSGQPATVSEEQGFRIHQVVSGETVFGLEKLYGIEESELLRLNPDLKNGLKAGMKLRLPEKQDQTRQNNVAVAQSGSKYRVEKGETIFSVASRFGVSVSDLKKANPALYTRGVQAGETILIPEQLNADQSSVAEETDNQYKTGMNLSLNPNCAPDAGAKMKKYKVALLLPLYLPDNDTIQSDSIATRGHMPVKGGDSASLFSRLFFNNQRVATGTDTTVVAAGINIDPRAAGFVEFYEGAILALDSIRHQGMNVELFVFDANNRKDVINLIQQSEFLDMNLIIGPVYPDLQAIVASFAAKNRIPLVSPLSNGGNIEQTNSWYVKAVPTRDFQVDQTARYISLEFKNRNFILVKESGNNPSVPEARLGQLCRQTFASGKSHDFFHEYDFQQKDVNSVKANLDPSGENIFVIPSDNEAQVSVAVANIDALAGTYNIILMGTAAFTKMKSIQTENFHDVRLRYLSPYYVDYKKPLVRRFVERYRNVFSGEPTMFSFQGFDVTFYFMSALFRYGQDFRGCLPDFPMTLTQMNFDFRKVGSMGGYMNENLFIVSYERNFDVLNYGVFDPKN